MNPKRRVSQFAKDVSSSPLRPRKIILDLRGNPGGLLEESAATAALFLAPDSVVCRESNNAGVSQGDYGDVRVDMLLAYEASR
jgi:C-terminal processing protease CtpA/Prc